VRWTRVPSNRISFYSIDTVDIDANRHADKVKGVKLAGGPQLDAELEKLSKYIKIPSLGHIKEPATIVDKFGLILVWHLPEIISSQRVVGELNHSPTST